MLIFDYFYWHYLAAPKKILQIWGNFLKFAVFYFIPVPQLLKTLISPWKKDVTFYGRGFDIKRFFETLIFNVISRVLGALVRSATILLALLFEFFVLAAGLVFLFFWFFWPFFLASSLVSTIVFAFQPAAKSVSALFVLLFLLATVFVFVLFYKKSKQKDPRQMSLAEIFEQKWSAVIWERLGLAKDEIPIDVLDEPGNFLIDFLNKKSIEKEDFESTLEWQVLEENQRAKRKKFWEKENLFGGSGVGRSWLYGWTNNLDKFSKEVKFFADSINSISRQKELDAMERILCKSQQSNVLLVGEPGVGKKTVVNQFAKLVAEGKVALPLAWRRVVELDLNAALAGLIDEGQINQRLIRIFSEAARAGNIILVIGDLHNFVSPFDFRQKNIAQILLPFLEGARFQLIAITTYEGLHTAIEKNASLTKFFEKVEIKEPDFSQTMAILQNETPKIERRIKKRITYQALKETIKTADQYISDAPQPEKSLDLLEEAAIAASNGPDYFVLPKHIHLVVSQKTEIPVGELDAPEKEKLINLEGFIHRRVVDQEEAVKEISSAMRRARMGVAIKSRPMGSFLFLGPTGVGKTETAKALAEAYFGSENRMLRFDMSEYQGPTAVERMIGSSFSQQAGAITTAVRENPFSLLLLDEIEKADANVLNLFLQVLDEGWLTDAFGRRVNFRNLIIIATSNASAELIRQMVQQGANLLSAKQKILDYIQQNGIFKPEFLNRFDGIVLFRPLSEQDVLKISELMLDGLAKRLEEQNILFKPNRQLIEKVASLGFEPTSGARAMRRVIQDKVEDLIAKKMLNGEIKKNEAFEIKVEEIQ